MSWSAMSEMSVVDFKGDRTGNARRLGVQKDAVLKVLEKQPDEGNSKYKVGMNIEILIDEVLNNRIRAVLVYDHDFTNQFTDFEVYELAAAMRHNTSVVAVNICGVDVSDQAISLLCDSMKKSNVRCVDLTHTPVDDDSGRALVELISKNPCVRSVVVDDTLISEDVLDDIDMACQNNEIQFGPQGDPPPLRSKKDRSVCVNHLNGVCMFGATCANLHPLSAQRERRAPAVPVADKPAGATWRAKDEAEVEFKAVFDKEKFREAAKQRQLQQKKSPKPADRPWSSILLNVFPVAAVAICATIVVVSTLRK